MNTEESQPKNFSSNEENQLSCSEFQKTKESTDRVWKNLERILDQFEQDLLKNKEELTVIPKRPIQERISNAFKITQVFASNLLQTKKG